MGSKVTFVVGPGSKVTFVVGPGLGGMGAGWLIGVDGMGDLGMVGHRVEDFGDGDVGRPFTDVSRGMVDFILTECVVDVCFVGRPGPRCWEGIGIGEGSLVRSWTGIVGLTGRGGVTGSVGGVGGTSEGLGGNSWERVAERVNTAKEDIVGIAIW